MRGEFPSRSRALSSYLNILSQNGIKINGFLSNKKDPFLGIFVALTILKLVQRFAKYLLPLGQLIGWHQLFASRNA